MKYKIELRYSYGWDDAGWTDETDNETKPTRFETVAEADAALEELFANVKVAVRVGDMSAECDVDDYRIVMSKD